MYTMYSSFDSKTSNKVKVNCGWQWYMRNIPFPFTYFVAYFLAVIVFLNFYDKLIDRKFLEIEHSFYFDRQTTRQTQKQTDRRLYELDFSYR